MNNPKIVFDTNELLKNFNSLNEKVKKEMREAESRNIKSVNAASKFIANT